MSKGRKGKKDVDWDEIESVMTTEPAAAAAAAVTAEGVCLCACNVTPAFVSPPLPPSPPPFPSAPLMCAHPSEASCRGGTKARGKEEEGKEGGH